MKTDTLHLYLFDDRMSIIMQLPPVCWFHPSANRGALKANCGTLNNIVSCGTLNNIVSCVTLNNTVSCVTLAYT